MNTKEYYIYDIFEALRQYSDDSDISYEHISYLIDNNRALLLRQKYKEIGQIVPQGIRQRLHFELELSEDNIFMDIASILRTVNVLPRLIESGDFMRSIHIDFGSYNQYKAIYIQPERFNYCGNNPELQNAVYTTLGQDYRLYFKGFNESHKLISNARIWAIFENPEAAWRVSADYDNTESFDKDVYYPIDADMWVTIKEVILKQLITSMQIPEDKINNADEQ